MNHHTQILRIARAGNPARALRLFGERGLDQRKDDPKLLTLHGRLLKDRARQCSGDERAALFRDASAAYLAAFEREPDTYPLINAAALELLAGNQTASRKYAQRVLDMLAANPDEGETLYWREATKAEALLLLNRPAEAKAALAAAIEKLPLAHEDLAATIGQFEAIIAAQNENPGWLEAHRPPCSLHFSGLIGLDPNASGLREAIEEKIAELNPGYAFGALAAGADIMIAEAAASAGAQLHVVLPSSISAFRATSVEPYGADWYRRFDTLIEQAATLETLSGIPEQTDHPIAPSIEFASLVAMGQTLRNTENLSSKAHALTIAAPGERTRPHISRWLQSGRTLESIDTYRQSAGEHSDGTSSEMQLASLVLITECDRRSIEHIAQKHQAVSVPQRPECFFITAPETIEAFVKECLDTDRHCRASIAFDIIDLAHPKPALLDQLRLIARTDEFGRIMTDRQSALLAQVVGHELRFEEAGEIASLYGPISLWAARS